MGQLVEFKGKHGSVLIQSKSAGGAAVATGRLDDAIAAVGASLEQVFGLVGDVAEGFRKTVKLDDLDTAEIELGLQVTGKGTIYIVETTGEAALKVKLTFKGSAKATETK